jgi:hypothetical protein
MPTYADTPTRCRVKGIIEFSEFCTKNSLTRSPICRKLEQFIKKGQATINRILNSIDRRIYKNETRGRKGLISKDTKNKIVALIKDYGYKGHD